METISHLFLDIGGVLLTNGWDHDSRKGAAAHFGLKFSEIESRHRLIFELFETGAVTLDDYLERVVFYEKRPFTRAQFRRFMFDQSKPYPEMLELMARLKERYGLKVVVVSNEGRELNAYRIEKFKLARFVDSFISSSFVGLRKPSGEIFRLALESSQAKAERVVYIENTPMFIEVAEGLGIRAVLHTGYRSTCAALAALGLV